MTLDLLFDTSITWKNTYPFGLRTRKTFSDKRGGPRGVPFLPSKIALCSHFPTVFPSLFPVKRICLTPSATIKILTIFFFVPLFPETSGRPSEYGVYNPPLPLQNICTDKGLQYYVIVISVVRGFRRKERVNHPQKMSSSDVINNQDVNYRGLR